MISEKKSFQNKVCILTSVHSLFDTRIFYKEAKSLARKGYDVTLIVQHDKNEIIDGIRIVSLPRPKNRFERMTRTVWIAYRKALKIDANIYHFHDPELMTIGLLLKLRRKHVVYDVHEDLPRQNLSKTYIPIIFRKPTSLLLESLENFAARRFDRVITATHFINQRFLGIGANVVNVNNYPIISELIFDGNKWKQKENAVCYVGGIEGIRGAFEMIEAIGKTEYILLIAGNINPNIEGKLRVMPGWDHVESFGFVNRKGVREIFSRSTAGLVVLHPIKNYLDSLPVKMFEYMSAGIPVIASNFPLWREIVEGAECGICVDPLDTEEIAGAIKWIIEHPDEAKRMGKNGRRAVEEKYNWRMEEKKLLDLYEEML